MKYGFATQVTYTALDGKRYPAVVLGKHNVPAEGDYLIAFKQDNGNAEATITHCWEDRLERVETTMLDLLEKERRRAMKIAHTAMDEHKAKHKVLKDLGNPMAFMSENIAEECRIIGNTISGGNALSAALGETVRDRIEQEYFATSTEQPHETKTPHE